jgi:hypothetical protein
LIRGLRNLHFNRHNKIWTQKNQNGRLIMFWPLFGKGYKAIPSIISVFVLDYIQIPVPQRWYELRMSRIQVIITIINILII